MQNGWSLRSDEQVLSHTTGLKVPIELQNRSVMVQGWIRVLAEAPESDSVDSANVIHAVKAELMDELHRGQIGWNLDQMIWELVDTIQTTIRTQVLCAQG